MPRPSIFMSIWFRRKSKREGGFFYSGFLSSIGEGTKLVSSSKIVINLLRTSKKQCCGAGDVEPPYFNGAGAGAVIFVKRRLRLRTIDK